MNMKLGGKGDKSIWEDLGEWKNMIKIYFKKKILIKNKKALQKFIYIHQNLEGLQAHT